MLSCGSFCVRYIPNRLENNGYAWCPPGNGVYPHKKNKLFSHKATYDENKWIVGVGQNRIIDDNCICIYIYTIYPLDPSGNLT